jgi:dihydropteroate synthase
MRKRPDYVIQARRKSISLGQKTCIMGVLNMTPDSFSGDGLLSRTKSSIHQALRQAQKIMREGADILDIGGESSRPGAKTISAKEEIQRVIPLVEKLAKNTNVLISVDTCKLDVAKEALDAGAHIINNIEGTTVSRNFLKMVRNYGAAIVLMHMRGQPRTMQKRIFYRNLIPDIIRALRKSIQNCLDIGMNLDRIIVDPGIGFGKTVEHNLEIIRRLSEFHALKCPVLIGTSRKSFIGKILNQNVQHRLSGTLAAVCASILNGAHIVRVHDVRQTKEAAIMIDSIQH